MARSKIVIDARFPDFGLVSFCAVGRNMMAFAAVYLDVQHYVTKANAIYVPSGLPCR